MAVPSDPIAIALIPIAFPLQPAAAEEMEEGVIEVTQRFLREVLQALPSFALYGRVHHVSHTIIFSLAAGRELHQSLD